MEELKNTFRICLSPKYRRCVVYLFSWGIKTKQS